MCSATYTLKNSRLRNKMVDPIGTAVHAANLLYACLQFYHQVKTIPNTIRQSIEQSLKYNDDLKVALGVFERLDRSSIEERQYEILSWRFVKLEGLLHVHKHELVAWMEDMGIPKPTFETESQARKDTLHCRTLFRLLTYLY